MFGYTSRALLIYWTTYENLKIFCWSFPAWGRPSHDDGWKFRDPWRLILEGLLDEANSIAEWWSPCITHSFKGEDRGAKRVAIIIVVVATDPTSKAVSLDVHSSYNSIIYAFIHEHSKAVACVHFKDPIISDKVNFGGLQFIFLTATLKDTKWNSLIAFLKPFKIPKTRSSSRSTNTCWIISEKWRGVQAKSEGKMSN